MKKLHIVPVMSTLDKLKRRNLQWKWVVGNLCHINGTWKPQKKAAAEQQYTAPLTKEDTAE